MVPKNVLFLLLDDILHPLHRFGELGVGGLHHLDDGRHHFVEKRIVQTHLMSVEYGAAQ